jgi:hypothetical protein
MTQRATIEEDMTMKKDTKDFTPTPTDRGLTKPERGGSGGYADKRELDRLDKIGSGRPGSRRDRGAIDTDADE